MVSPNHEFATASTIRFQIPHHFLHFVSTFDNLLVPSSSNPKSLFYRLLLSHLHSTMNWTGGRLQRHQKNSGNTSLRRQKQHFAKVRQQLQNGEVTPQSMRFRPSSLLTEVSNLRDGITPSSIVLQKPSSESNKFQAKLEDFSATAPLARRLASIKKRSSPLQHVHTSKLKAVALQDHRKHIQGPSSFTPTSALRLRKTRIKSHISSSTSDQKRHNVHRVIGKDSLEASRHTLLAKSDWVGLSPSRPLQMQFSSYQEKERIGKRRKIDREIKSRREQFRDESVHFNKGVGKTPEREICVNSVLGGIPKDINVRIGDDALISQVSITQQQIPQVEALLTLPRESSDTMLFDAEQAGELRYWAAEAHRYSPNKGNSQQDAEVRLESDLDTAYVPAFDTNPFFLASIADTQLSHERDGPAHSTNEMSEEGETVEEHDRGEVHHLIDETNRIHPSYAHESDVTKTNSFSGRSGQYYQTAVPQGHLAYHSLASLVGSHHSTDIPLSDHHIVPADSPDVPGSAISQYAMFISSPFLQLSVDSTPSRAFNDDHHVNKRRETFLSTSTSGSDGEMSTSHGGKVSHEIDMRSSEAATRTRQKAASTQRATGSRYGVSSGGQAIQSSSTSLRDMLALATRGILMPTLRQTESELQDALWKKFVFGSDEEGIPSENSDEEIAQLSASMSNTPVTSHQPQALGTATELKYQRRTASSKQASKLYRISASFSPTSGQSD
jgi:hypothetical protein